MESFALSWALEAMQAQIVGEPDGEVFSICTDSRQAAPGALFFALQGEQTDGHRFVAQALAAGAVGAVVAHPVEAAGGTQLVVSDPLIALGDLAQRYRAGFSLPVVGITGSVGKTSTKEMVATILETRFQTLANRLNYNNEIGVPLTLFRLKRSDTAAVIEMGMRGLGEIDRLAQIAQPTLAVITNIGSTHIQRLGSRENIARAKSEILTHLPADGVVILPERLPFDTLVRSHIPKGCRLLTTAIEASETADLWVEADKSAQVAPDKTSFLLHVRGERMPFPVSLSAIGVHNRNNAVQALAVGHALGVPFSDAIAALESWTGAEGRMMVRHTATGLTILDDCYNAAPESMRAALHTLQAQAGSRVAILGDMRELGDYAHDLHVEVGAAARHTGLRLLVTVGELAGIIADAVLREHPEAPPIQRFGTTAECVAQIHSLVRSGDTVLVKGSRALEMEKIVAALTGEASGHRHG